MVEKATERVQRMQNYLKQLTEKSALLTKSERLEAETELFNYYHSDWAIDATHFANQNLELFDDIKIQQSFSPSKSKTPRTRIRSEEKSKYKRPLRPGEA